MCKIAVQYSFHTFENYSSSLTGKYAIFLQIEGKKTFFILNEIRHVYSVKANGKICWAIDVNKFLVTTMRWRNTANSQSLSRRLRCDVISKWWYKARVSFHLFVSILYLSPVTKGKSRNVERNGKQQNLTAGREKEFLSKLQRGKRMQRSGMAAHTMLTRYKTCITV